MNRYVGAALSPRETRKLVLGRGSYVGDLTAPGMLHAAFVRSPHAHARIVRIDVERARRAPGIATVLSGRDLAEMTAPLRIAPPILHDDADVRGACRNVSLMGWTSAIARLSAFGHLAMIAVPSALALM